MKIIVTIDQVKEYIRLDYDDPFINELLLEVSLIYIDSMVGEAYKKDPKAIKLSNLLQLKIISDMYDQRSTVVPNNTKEDRITTSILDKLSNYTE